MGRRLAWEVGRVLESIIECEQGEALDKAALWFTAMDQLRVDSNDPELAVAILTDEAPPISVCSPGQAGVSLETGRTHLLPPDLMATSLGLVREVDSARERSRRNRGPPRWWDKPPEGPGNRRVGEFP